MTLQEAQRLAAIIGTIDRGCNSCVDDFVARLNTTFPEFVWAALDIDQFYDSPADKRVSVEARR